MQQDPVRFFFYNNKNLRLRYVQKKKIVFHFKSLFNFKINRFQKRGDTTYKAVALGTGLKKNRIVSGNTFKVIFRHKFKNKVKGLGLVISQRSFYQKMDGSFTKTKVNVATGLKKKKSRKLNKFGFFLNYRNNLKFLKKYKLVL
jgi:hypothetical protein